jgi:hypothetical protein
LGGGLGIGAGGQVNLGVGGGQAGLRSGANPIDMKKGVASAAVATELGEHFQYQIEQPVSLARQKSALLPIVNQAVEATKLSIYNETVHSKYPLLGFRFKNTTGLHLMQGPLTVFEGNSYAGDAQIGDLQPKEERLVSYAVDLGMEVAPEARESSNDMVAIKLVKGIFHATHKLRQAKLYTMKNRSEKPRRILVEHPYQAEWRLVGDAKPAERTRDLYRFEAKVEPGQSTKLLVAEEMKKFEQRALADLADEGVRILIQSSVVSPKLNAALEDALARRHKVAQVQQAVTAEEKALDAISNDQSRIRANLASVPPSSEAYKRYLKKLDDQETEIETRRAQVAKLRESARELRAAYDSFVGNLEVD